MTSEFPAPVRPLPIPTWEDEEFWSAASEHRLVLPQCRDCGHIWFPPYGVCPSCLSKDREWIRCSGKGTVVGVIVFHRQYIPAFMPPYHVAIVELEEGPRMCCNVMGFSENSPLVGMDVEVAFEDVGDSIALPQFRRRM